MLKLMVWDDANKVYWFQNTSWQSLFLNLEPSYLQNVLGDHLLNWMIFSLSMYFFKSANRLHRLYSAIGTRYRH